MQDLNQKCKLPRPEVTLITHKTTLKMSKRNQRSARAALCQDKPNPGNATVDTAKKSTKT